MYLHQATRSSFRTGPEQANRREIVQFPPAELSTGHIARGTAPFVAVYLDGPHSRPRMTWPERLTCAAAVLGLLVVACEFARRIR